MIFSSNLFPIFQILLYPELQFSMENLFKNSDLKFDEKNYLN